MFKKINGTTQVLEKALDASWKRNETIAMNVANVDTPGYKRKTVRFEEFLDQALDDSKIIGRRTHEKHIPVGRKDMDSLRMQVTQDNRSLSMRLDGNNVDIDNEMADMAKNTIQYNVLTQSLNSQIKRLKSAINEGRR